MSSKSVMPPRGIATRRNAIRGKSSRFVRLCTDRRRIRAHAASVLFNRRGEKTMKRNAIRSGKSPNLPIAWREAEYAALWADAADRFDDRVSENIFDVEDERAQVDIIVHGMDHDLN
jgi:hypothetical protein